MNWLKFYASLYIGLMNLGLVLDAYALWIMLMAINTFLEVPFGSLYVAVVLVCSGLLWFFCLLVDYSVLSKGWQNVFKWKKKEVSTEP